MAHPGKVTDWALSKPLSAELHTPGYAPNTVQAWRLPRAALMDFMLLRPAHDAIRSEFLCGVCVFEGRLHHCVYRLLCACILAQVAIYSADKNDGEICWEPTKIFPSFFPVAFFTVLFPRLFALTNYKMQCGPRTLYGA